MKVPLFFCILLTWGSCIAKGAVPDLSWSTLKNEGLLLEGELVGETLKLENSSTQPQTFKLLVLPQPGVQSPSYAINGQVKYEGVDGIGYLEMLNHFPEDKVYFTRTLASFGPQRHIQGSSDWRAFSLPFYVRDESGWLEDRPEKLEMNLVLPGKGTVYLRSINLAMQDTGENQTGAWWGIRTAGWMGGIFGGMMGVVGAITGILASRGKARSFVLSVYWGLFGLGLCLLVVGIFAVIRHQPYAVYYPLLFAGGLFSVLCLTLMSLLRRRYQAQELRRMSAADA